MGNYVEHGQECCEAMGEELGSAYHLLWNQCALLHMRWEEYLELFGKTQAEFDVMNATAPGFFKSVQDVAWEHILLGLCKFADPAKVAHRRTLSLDSLLQMKQSSEVPSLVQLVTVVKERTRFAQDWRNRRIAHNDLEHALDKQVKPLLPASRVHVREALEAIHAVLEAISVHFTQAGLAFSGTSYSWGGTHLLRELRLATRLREERQVRLNRGEPIDGDLDWSKWH